MRLRLISFLLVVVVPLGCFGQDGQPPIVGPPKATLVDEFGLPCSEDLMSRYDFYLGILAGNPSATGVVILYGDRTSEGRNKNLYRYISEFYPRVRQFRNFSIRFLRGGNQDKTRVQFWMVPSGAQIPTVVEPFKVIPITATTRYDVAAADFHVNEKKTYLYHDGFYELGCDFAPDEFGFVDLLRNDRSLVGYIVVYTKFGTGVRYGRRAGRFALNRLVRSRRVAASRIKTIYGGNRRDPEIELWLVPKGGRLPPVAPDSEINPK